MNRIAISALVLLALLLAGCGADAPPPAATSPATEATQAASTEAATAATTPATEAPASDTDKQIVIEATTPDNADATAATEAVAAPEGPAPREGIDYTVIEPAAPMSATPGKIEVVEVFAYYCIHCANLQARVTPWKKTLAADVEFRYAPMAHGSSEPIARGFYAAEAMGELDRTHEAMFKAIAVDRKLKQGTLEEVAGLYADMGVDRAALESTMKSFAVNAQIARNQKTIARWAIESTPTIVVNGHYRANVTQDRGHDGLLRTVEHLIARERAALGTSAPQ